MKKKLFALIAVFILLPFMLTAGGKKQEAPANTGALKQIEGGNGIVRAKPELTGLIRIGYYSLNELTGPDPITGQTVYGADELMKWLKKDYPNMDFEIIAYPGTADHYVRAKALMDARQVDLMIESSTQQIYQEGYSMDLTPFINADPEYKVEYHSSPLLGYYYREINPQFPDDITKRIANCLPYNGGPDILWYDKEIFKQWGVEPLSKDPTPDEIYDKAKRMTGKNPVTGQQNYGLFFPTGGKPATWNMAVLVGYYGGDIGDNMPNEWDTKVTVNTPPWIKALTWVKSIQPFTPPGAETGQGAELFYTANNNIAMRFDGASNQAFVIEALGLTDKYEPSNRPEDKDGNHARLGGVRVQVMKTASNPQLAWEVAKWFSEGNGQRFLVSTQLGWPTSIKALGDDFQMSDFMRRTMEVGSHITKKTPIDSLQIHLIMIEAIESVTLKNVDPKVALDNAEKVKEETYARLKAAAGK